MPLLLAFAAATAVAAARTVPQPLAFEDVTVIDCAGAPARAHQTVVVSNRNIAEVGSKSSIAVPTNALRINSTGKYLIPGLWDMHVHLLWGPVAQFLPLCIANGVTGVRDLHTQLSPEDFRSLREKISTGTQIGPRLISSGPIVDGPRPWWPGSIAVTNAADARKTVHLLKSQGWDMVKVYETIPRDAYFALADEAKKEAIPFGGHTPAAITALEASQAGQKSIEHLSRVWEACCNSAEGGRALAFNEEKGLTLLRVFKENHTWQCPTLVVQVGCYRKLEDMKNDPRLKYVSKKVQQQAFWSEAREAAPDRREWFQHQMELVKRMQREGIGILAGTDAIMPQVYPGFSLHDELALLVKAGLSQMEALQAATINPAKFLKLDDSLGTIEKGKLAELILLDADPVQDIANTKKINAVVANGRLFDRPTLDQILHDVQTDVSKDKP